MLKGHKVVLVDTVGMAVVVITISCFNKLSLLVCTTWSVFDNITPVFEKYSHNSQHTQVNDKDMRILERFTCLHSHNSGTTTFESVNEPSIH